MNSIEYNNLIQYPSAETYTLDVLAKGRYARANFRRRALHFRVKDQRLYKVCKSMR